MKRKRLILTAVLLVAVAAVVGTYKPTLNYLILSSRESRNPDGTRTVGFVRRWGDSGWVGAQRTYHSNGTLLFETPPCADDNRWEGVRREWDAQGIVISAVRYVYGHQHSGITGTPGFLQSRMVDGEVVETRRSAPWFDEETIEDSPNDCPCHQGSG